jgi:hypothetical protein
MRWQRRKRTKMETDPTTKSEEEPSTHDESALVQPPIVRLGDYVLATKYSDCDPNDPWRVGFLVRIIHTWNKPDRFIVGEQNGTWSDFYEYLHAKKITAEEGREWIEANTEASRDEGGAKS